MMGAAAWPLISVIVPVYNVEKYVRRAVESLIRQTYPCMEIILVDDGSPDASGRICDELAGVYENVRVIHQENKGVSAARNAGLDVMRGEYFGFVDPDDFVEPDMYEFLYRALKAGGADIACCSFDHYFQNGTVPYEGERFFDVVAVCDAVARDIKSGLYITWNKLFACSTCGAIRYNEFYVNGEDRLFAVQAMQRAGRVAYAMEDKYHYFHRAGSAGTKRFTRGDYRLIACCEEIVEICRSMGEECSQMAELMLTDAYMQLLIMPGVEAFTQEYQALQAGLRARAWMDFCSISSIKRALLLFAPRVYRGAAGMYHLIRGKRQMLFPA